MTGANSLSDTFGPGVQTAERFERAWRKLPRNIQHVVQAKVTLLVANPRHPSLHIHQLQRTREAVWVCYISVTYRLLYQRRDATLLLCDIGGHTIVDRAHLRGR
jgi:mRNA-degrading endonuclease YafQ of YafQ-DinJ toxin-antitoxin module